MCGRFSIHIADLEEMREPPEWTPRYNVAPTQSAPVIVQRPERTLVPMRWGLVPRWAVDPDSGAKTINARIETAAQRPSFREAMAQRRCVVPATGFFEWKRRRGVRGKQPMWIHARDGGVLALAGLWEHWTAPDGSSLEAFALGTRDAPGLVREMPDRMAGILSQPGIAAWLDPDTTPGQLTRALGAVAADVTMLKADPVATAVNTPAHDAADCIAALAEAPARPQLDLFGDDGL
jgi:putative SOS response-associated peptidase YedK